MCNYRCIDRSCKARLFIALRLSIALPALIFSAVSCFPLRAQGPAMPGFGLRFDEFDVVFERGGFEHGGTAHMDSVFPARSAAPPSDALKVSVDELRHPLTGRARRVLATAWRYAQQGDHARAVSTLREGMAKAAAVIPYAHALLGIEYLHLGRNAEAVPEFTAAATSFPHDAVVHSNFAVSLCIVGQFDRAEREARLALYLDPALRPAQELVSMLEANEARQARR